MPVKVDLILSFNNIEDLQVVILYNIELSYTHCIVNPQLSADGYNGFLFIWELLVRAILVNTCCLQKS